MRGPQLGRLMADAIRRRGTLVYLRTTVDAQNGGPIPPVIDAPILHAALSIGDTTLSIDANSATGVLSAGDTIIVAGQSLVVAAPVAARAASLGVTAGWDDVTLAAPATAAASAGAAVSFTWVADVAVPAIIKGYPTAVVNGDNIQSKDLNIRIASWNQTEPNPETQKIMLNGDVRSIINVAPAYGVSGEQVYWDIQTR